MSNEELITRLKTAPRFLVDRDDVFELIKRFKEMEAVIEKANIGPV